MKTIYAVTAGEYSDYRIVAVFSSKEKADVFMTALPRSTDYDGYNDIEEFELDPNTADLIRRGYFVWNVRMLRDGTVEDASKMDMDTNMGTKDEPHIWRRSQAPAYIGTGTPDCITCYAWAKTEKQAIKIVNEKRAQMIAMNKWPEDEAA